MRWIAWAVLLAGCGPGTSPTWSGEEEADAGASAPEWAMRHWEALDPEEEYRHGVYLRSLELLPDGTFSLVTQSCAEGPVRTPGAWTFVSGTFVLSAPDDLLWWFDGNGNSGDLPVSAELVLLTLDGEGSLFGETVPERVGFTRNAFGPTFAKAEAQRCLDCFVPPDGEGWVPRFEPCEVP